MSELIEVLDGSRDWWIENTDVMVITTIVLAAVDVALALVVHWIWSQ